MRCNHFRIAAAWTVLGAIVLFAVAPAAVAAADVVAVWSLDDQGPSQLAALAAGERLRASGLTLVDRDAIAAVLKEHAITAAGLADATEALRLGKLLAARYLVLIQAIPNDDNQTPSFSIRAIETANGIVLADQIVEPTAQDQIESVVQRATDELLARINLPLGQRRYVAMLGVTPTVAGDEALDRACAALHSLIRSDLTRLPQVIVVEREQLAAVTREHAIAGESQQVQSSGWLIEATLGPEANQWQLTLRLTPVGGGEPVIVKSMVAQDQAAAARTAAVDQITTTLNTTPMTLRPNSADEARRLSMRACWLANAGRYSEAVQHLEAMMALDSSERRLKSTYRSLRLVNYGANSINSDTFRLRRFMLQMMDHMIRDQDSPDSRWASDLFLLLPETSDKLRQALPLEQQPLVDQFNAHEQQLLAYLIQVRKQRGELPKEEYEELIEDAIERHGSEPTTFLRVVLPLLTEVYDYRDRRLAANPPQEADLREFTQVLDRVNQRAYNLRSEPGETHFPDLIPLGDLLVSRGPISHQLRGHTMLAKSGDPVRAARSAAWIMTLFFDEENPQNHDFTFEPDFYIGYPVEYAIEVLYPQGGRRAWLDNLLNKAEGEGKVSPFMRQPEWLTWQYQRHYLKDDISWAKRILAALPEPTQADPANVRRGVEDLTRRLNEHIGQVERRIAVAFVKSPWFDLDIRPLTLTPTMPDGEPVWFDIDASDRAAAEDRQLVMIWQHERGRRNDIPDEYDISVIRTSINGGPNQVLGRGKVLAEVTNDFAITMDRIFIPTYTGLAEFKDNHMRLLGIAQGIPEGRIKAATALDDVVLVVMEGDLLRLDPPYTQARTIASSRSIQKRNGLDGSNRYYFWGMVPDHRARRFLIQFFDLWYYDPYADVLERVPNEGRAELHPWDRSVIAQYWDGNTGQGWVKNRLFYYHTQNNRFEALPNLIRRHNWAPMEIVNKSPPLVFADMAIAAVSGEHTWEAGLYATGQKVFYHPRHAQFWRKAYQLGDIGVIQCIYPDSIWTIRRKASGTTEGKP
jgi:hypothetical protein